jgi:hypothetical protein
VDEIATSLIPSDERQILHHISADDIHESILVPVSSLDIACRDRRGNRWKEAAALIVAEEYGMPSSDHCVEPSVVVEVRRDGSHRIGAWSLQDAAGLGNFFEGSIALVAIEIVVSERKTAWAAVHGYSFEVAVRILARLRNAVKIQIDVSRDE